MNSEAASSEVASSEAGVDGSLRQPESQADLMNLNSIFSDGVSHSGILNRFLSQLDGLQNSYSAAVPAIANIHSERLKKAKTLLELSSGALTKLGAYSANTPERDEFARQVIVYSDLGHRALSQITHSIDLISNALFISVFTVYDGFLSDLLADLYSRRTEILKRVDRSLTLNQLMDFSSIEAAKASLIRKEIESVLRESYSEQFKILSNRFSMPLTTGLKVWPEFIEMSQRRNLLVHAGGVVSQQYIDVCNEVGVKWPDNKVPEVGTNLTIKPLYFYRSIAVCHEVGFKLAHTLCRKLFPDCLSDLDNHLINHLYFLLFMEKWDLAIVLGEYATSLPRWSDDLNYRKLLLNLAQAYKWKGDQKNAIACLEKKDWSSSSYYLRLAYYVILNNYTEAARLMRLMGKDGEVSKIYYVEWPIFREFRKTSEFEEAFEGVFGEPYLKYAMKAVANINSERVESSQNLEADIENTLANLPSESGSDVDDLLNASTSGLRVVDNDMSS